MHLTTHLEKLLAYHESAAAALRVSIGLVKSEVHARLTTGRGGFQATIRQALDAEARKHGNGHTNGQKVNGKAGHDGSPGIAGILARQQARTETKRRAGHRDRRGRGMNAAKAETRKRVAALLAQLDTTEPRSWPGKGGIGPLMRTGYIKRKGDGYVRTSKPYINIGSPV